MQKQLYDFDKLIAFRRDIHKHAEGSFKEFRTNAKILEYLKDLGIKETQIKKIARTGLVVDIKGTAAPSGKPFCIAYRADMDALPIKEQNPSIDYASITDYAHMCGHDTHVASLIGGASKILEKIDQIPSDKCVRLLFQPAEEQIGGAFPMVQEGATLGVDEVYGMHNWPYGAPGKVHVKSGYLMARITVIEITIHGKGGPSSDIEDIVDPLQPAIDIENGLKEIVKEYKEKGFHFTVSLPYIRTATSPDQVSDTCRMEGLLRSYDDECTLGVNKKLQDLIEASCKKYGCKVDYSIINNYPPVNNWPKETENFIKVAKKVVGDDNVTDQYLPVLGGEDFSYFQRDTPGVFFFLTSTKKEGDILHTCDFDPHEDYIPIACEMWLRLAEDRFGLEFK